MLAPGKGHEERNMGGGRGWEAESGVRKRVMRLGAETAHTRAEGNQLSDGRPWHFHRTSLGMRRGGRKHSIELVEGARNKPGTLRKLTTQCLRIVRRQHQKWTNLSKVYVTLRNLLPKWDWLLPDFIHLS